MVQTSSSQNLQSIFICYSIKLFFSLGKTKTLKTLFFFLVLRLHQSRFLSFVCDLKNLFINRSVVSSNSMSYDSNKNSFLVHFFFIHMCFPELATSRIFIYSWTSCTKNKSRNWKHYKILWLTSGRALRRKLYDCKAPSKFMDTKINISQLIYFVRIFMIGTYVIIRWGLNEMCIKYLKTFLYAQRVLKAFPFPFQWLHSHFHRNCETISKAIPSYVVNVFFIFHTFYFWAENIYF